VGESRILVERGRSIVFRKALCLFGCCVVAAALGALLASPEAGALAQHPYNKGCDLMARGEYRLAAAAFQKAVKLNPGDTDALNNLAVCQIELEQYAKALPLLRKVLALNPRYKGASLNTGADYIFQDQLSRAVPPTRAAQSAGGSAVARKVKADALFNLGLIYALQGDYQKAADAFRQSQDVQARNDTAIAMGASLCATGDYEKGIATLKQATQGASAEIAKQAKANVAVALYHRGLEKLAVGDIDGARQDLKASQGAQRTDAALIGAGMVEAEAADLSAAADAFTSVRDSTRSKAIKAMAQSNLDRALDLLDEQSRTLKWVVLGLGAALLVLFLAALVRAVRAARYRGRGGKWKIALGIIVGLCVAAVLVGQYLSPERSVAAVAVAMGIGLLVILLMWTGRTSWSG
jgi:tetratricopeptide (TPR) repeat protein